MVRAWYMDTSKEDQRLPHMLEPCQFVKIEDLAERLKVLYYKLDADNYDAEGLLQKLRDERGYSYQDEITCTPEKLPNYEQKLKMFFEEHIHSDEEIRFILDGSGYFDVRDTDERWIRIECVKGDLIILPAGIYHRFTLDTKDYIQAMRLFVGTPVWTPINRGEDADNHAARRNYVQSVGA